METRQTLYLDEIIAGLQALMQNHRDFYEDPLTVVEANLNCSIYDTLEAAGLPAAAIRAVLGSDMDIITDEPITEPLPCAYCEQAAAAVITVRDGSHRLACAQHADNARAVGMTITHFVEEAPAF